MNGFSGEEQTFNYTTFFCVSRISCWGLGQKNDHKPPAKRRPIACWTWVSSRRSERSSRRGWGKAAGG